MQLLSNPQISIIKWKGLIHSSPYGSQFQTPDFYQLCNSIQGLSADVYALEEGDNLIALCVITLQREIGVKGFFSRRAIIYGGPVLNSNTEEKAIECLLTSISNAYKNRSIYIEIRNLNDYSKFENAFLRNKWHYVPYQNFIVDCTDTEKIFKQLGNNRKREIKKALKAGVSIKEAENLIEVNKFYNILLNLYREKIKKPIFPKEFFEGVFINKFGKYFLVIYNEEIIGGILCPILEGTCIYEFYICALDEEFKEQYPSTMATWAAIEYANKNHIPVFDFMGAGRKDTDYGVREFKSRFGGELVEFGRYIKLNNKILYTVGKFGLKLMGLLRK
jgi:serine/alanine adding enzyme